MAAIRTAHPALQRGEQRVRSYGDTPGLFAFSRLDSAGGEILAAFNTGTEPLEAQVQVETGSLKWTKLHGDCAASASAPGSYRVKIEPLSLDRKSTRLNSSH